MSEAGYCPRALSAQHLGYEPEAKPEWLDRAAEEGKWHEERLVQEINVGSTVIKARQAEVKIEQPAFRLIGHIDGIIAVQKRNSTVLSDVRLLEIKSMSQYEFDRWIKGRFDEFPEYADQIACYIQALDNINEVQYFVKNRSSGYIDGKDNQPNIIRLEDIAFGDWTFAERIVAILDKLETVQAHIAKKELVPAVCDMSTLQCRRCFYKHLCIKSKEDMTIQDEATLQAAADKWRKGKVLEAEAKELIENAKETFAEHTIAANTKAWQFDELAISNITVKEHEVPARIQKEYSYIRIDDIRRDSRGNVT